LRGEVTVAQRSAIFSSSKRYSFETADVPAHHFAALGNHLVNGPVQIRHGFVRGNHPLFVIIDAGRFLARSVMFLRITAAFRWLTKSSK